MGEGTVMGTAAEERNKAFVLEAFDTVFNRRDYAAAQRFWSPNCLQHSAHIEPGEDGLFNLANASPPEMGYEDALSAANGDYVMAHGRFSNTGLAASWIVVDVVRLARRPARRTLGCPAGGGHRRGVHERAADVRRRPASALARLQSRGHRHRAATTGRVEQRGHVMTADKVLIAILDGQPDVFERGWALRLADLDRYGRLRLDAVARHIQDIGQDHVREQGFDESHPRWIMRRTVIDPIRCNGVDGGLRQYVECRNR
jgi:predicted SnoaL-like aldol condensation-catalyzing enzyme